MRSSNEETWERRVRVLNPSLTCAPGRATLAIHSSTSSSDMSHRSSAALAPGGFREGEGASALLVLVVHGA
jgi:hypothetical protein